MVLTNKWILDTREKVSKFQEEIPKEEWERNWTKERLVLSKFMILRDEDEDMDCADMTDEDANGLIEFKTFADLVGSCTGDNVNHLLEQTIKMYATGIPYCIIVYGYRHDYQMKSGVSDEYVLSALQKLTSIQAVLKVSIVYSVKDVKEAIEVGKTFLRKARELPRRMPIYNLFKQVEDIPVAMLCGIPHIGPVNGSAIVEKFGDIISFVKEVIDKFGITKPNFNNKGIKKKIRDMANGINNVGPINMQRVIEALYQNVR